MVHLRIDQGRLMPKSGRSAKETLVLAARTGRRADEGSHFPAHRVRWRESSLSGYHRFGVFRVGLSFFFFFFRYSFVLGTRHGSSLGRRRAGAQESENIRGRRWGPFVSCWKLEYGLTFAEFAPWLPSETSLFAQISAALLEPLPWSR